MTIEPDPNWYGTLSRRSAVADYIELLALRNHQVTVSSLADTIRDSGWTYLLGERILSDSEPPEPEDPDLVEELDTAGERAWAVKSVLERRVELGGARYPFSIDELGRVSYTGGEPPVDHPYIALLALTVGHATKVSAGRAPHEIFETTVVDALSRRGWPTVGLGTASRAGRTFEQALVESCAALGLSAAPTPPVRAFAQDEGSDVLSSAWPEDSRRGGVHLIGQITCARSDDWDRKIDEPSDHQWKSWLGRFRMPIAFLAVPHHVEDQTLDWLVFRKDRDVFDRLRLLLSKDTVSEEERELSEAVLQQDVVVL